MNKLVVLKLSGKLTTGFEAMLEVGPEDRRADYEVQGTLPQNFKLIDAIVAWRDLYHQTIQKNRQQTRKIKPLSVKQDGTLKNIRDRCRQQAQQLANDFQEWLATPGFQPIERGLRETLSPENVIRVLVRTEERHLHQLPWHQWDFLNQYPHAEVAFAPVTARCLFRPQSTDTLKILAILGRDEGIDVNIDQVLLKQLPRADVTILKGCDRRTFSEVLRAQPWHILFFAGHSETVDGETGIIYLNERDSLSLDELRYSLQDAIVQGLQVAIFNSCDGMGLAYDLNALYIPTLIVMREPIPDPVAHLFLQYFLTRFAQGMPLFEAVRKGREHLEEVLADQFPCGSWLPVIWQNPTTVPLAWPVNGRINQWAIYLNNRFMGKRVSQSSAVGLRPPRGFKAVMTALELMLVLLGSVSVSAGVVGLRYAGVLQGWEMLAYDHLMSLRPPEPLDNRLLIVKVTEADIRTEGSQAQQSITDADLEKLLEILFAASPRIVGLDIYRDFPVKAGHDKLAEFLGQGDRLITICRTDETRPGYDQIDEIEPAPEADKTAVGFADTIADLDEAHRRHLLYMGDYPGACQANYALSVHLAMAYLATEGIVLDIDERTYQWQFGQADFLPWSLHQGGYHQANSELEGMQIGIKYRIVSGPKPLRAFKEVTLGEVITGKVSPDFISDRVILIGAEASSFEDIIHTPYRQPDGGIRTIPGVLYQAHLTSQLIEAGLGHRSLLRVWPFEVDVFWIWGWGFLGGLLGWWMRRQAPWRLTLVIALCSLWGVSCVFLVLGSLWVPLVPAVIALVGGLTSIKALDDMSFDISLVKKNY